MKKTVLALILVTSVAILFAFISNVNAGTGAWSGIQRCPEHSKYDARAKKCICESGYITSKDGKCIKTEGINISADLLNKLDTLKTILSKPAIDESFTEALKKAAEIGKLSQVKAWTWMNPSTKEVYEKYLWVQWLAPPPPDNQYTSNYVTLLDPLYKGYKTLRIIKDVNPQDGKIDCFKDGSYLLYIIDYPIKLLSWCLSETGSTNIKTIYYGSPDFNKTLLDTAQAEFDFGIEMADYWYTNFLYAILLNNVTKVDSSLEEACPFYHEFDVKPPSGHDLKLQLSEGGCKIDGFCLKDEAMDAEVCYEEGIDKFENLKGILQKLGSTGSLK